ncbi:MAG: hypothetical protein AB1457_17985 [Chloroflexota bacterium]
MKRTRKTRLKDAKSIYLLPGECDYLARLISDDIKNPGSLWAILHGIDEDVLHGILLDVAVKHANKMRGKSTEHKGGILHK